MAGIAIRIPNVDFSGNNLGKVTIIDDAYIEQLIASYLTPYETAIGTTIYHEALHDMTDKLIRKDLINNFYAFFPMLGGLEGSKYNFFNVADKGMRFQTLSTYDETNNVVNFKPNFTDDSTKKIECDTVISSQHYLVQPKNTGYMFLCYSSVGTKFNTLARVNNLVKNMPIDGFVTTGNGVTSNAIKSFYMTTESQLALYPEKLDIPAPIPFNFPSLIHVFAINNRTVKAIQNFDTIGTQTLTSDMSNEYNVYPGYGECLYNADTNIPCGLLAITKNMTEEKAEALQSIIIDFAKAVNKFNNILV